ncbi:MAG5150 family histidine triad lipoprotein [Mycoplasma zalophi]|uniref:MAG5150 family histidine triad lipoprotein n=1 Tax=Mycoplasma zalophi TaxID=191287 RepID=UPI001C11EBB5|nr:hypothetical protein [Mycoplasma zalophi]MBU4691172.1 hypothetical protein [Mycoplasma zalophi]
MKKTNKKLFAFSLLTISTIAAISVPAIAASCAQENTENKKQTTSEFKNYENLKENYNVAKNFVINKIKVNADKFIVKAQAFTNSLKDLNNSLTEIAKSNNLNEEEKQTITNYVNTWLTIPEKVKKDQTSEYATSLNKLADISEDLELVMGTHISALNNKNNDFFENLKNIQDKLEEKNIKNDTLQSSLRNIWIFFTHTLVDPDHFTEEEHLHEQDVNPQNSNQHNHSHAAANLYYESLEWVDDFINVINKQNNNITNKDIIINTFNNTVKPLIIKANNEKSEEINTKFTLLKNNLETLISQNSESISSSLDFKLQKDSTAILGQIKTNLEALVNELGLSKNSVEFED